MYISFDYYRTFYYVAKYGSISQAAEALMNNQPNVSRTIKNLESELNCTLFVRSRKGVELTPEGEMLYAHVAAAVEHIQSGEEEICLERTLSKGVVTIGASEIALRCFLLPVLKDFRQKYPGIRIRVFSVTCIETFSHSGNANTSTSWKAGENSLKSIQPFSRADCSPFSSSLISRRRATIFSYS